jgi:hypothetical protein
MSVQIVSLESLVDTLNEKKDEQRITRAVKMDFSFVPRKRKVLIKIGDKAICSIGNVALLIAPPGSGKSNVCEAIAAGGLNPGCDSLGFNVDSENTLYIDTERVLNDLSTGLDRIKRRTLLDNDKIVKHLHLYSFIEMESTEASWDELNHLVSVGKYELVIVDGSADFVKSVNDEEESKSFWRKLISLANKLEFGMLLTIHPNPGDEEGKATGHLGSQGQKKAESVFNVFSARNDKDVKEITTSGPHGKVRNAEKGGLTSSFKWSKDKSMFISCDRAISTKIENITDMFKGDKKSYSYKELCKAWMDVTKESLSTAKRKIKEAKEIQDIVELGGVYWLNGDEQEVKKDEEDDLPF